MEMGLVYDDGLGFKVMGFVLWRWIWFYGNGFGFMVMGLVYGDGLGFMVMGLVLR